MFKSEGGITLVALIITIIILIILAAVSISALTRDNIIGMATEGAKNYADAAITENSVLKSFEDKISSIDGVLSEKFSTSSETSDDESSDASSEESSENP